MHHRRTNYYDTAVNTSTKLINLSEQYGSLSTQYCIFVSANVTKGTYGEYTSQYVSSDLLINTPCFICYATTGPRGGAHTPFVHQWIEKN